MTQLSNMTPTAISAQYGIPNVRLAEAYHNRSSGVSCLCVLGMGLGKTQGRSPQA